MESIGCSAGVVALTMLISWHSLWRSSYAFHFWRCRRNNRHVCYLAFCRHLYPLFLFLFSLLSSPTSSPYSIAVPFAIGNFSPFTCMGYGSKGSWISVLDASSSVLFLDFLIWIGLKLAASTGPLPKLASTSQSSPYSAFFFSASFWFSFLALVLLVFLVFLSHLVYGVTSYNMDSFSQSLFFKKSESGPKFRVGMRKVFRNTVKFFFKKSTLFPTFPKCWQCRPPLAQNEISGR